MPHLKKDPVTGHLVKKGGCQPGTNEILFTVSGAGTEVVQWGGETWTLPGDSGDQRAVCVTRSTGVAALGPTVIYTTAYVAYDVAIAGGLEIHRKVGTVQYQGNWYRGGGGPGATAPGAGGYFPNQNAIYFAPIIDSVTVQKQDRVGFFGGFSPSPAASRAAAQPITYTQVPPYATFTVGVLTAGNPGKMYYPPPASNYLIQPGMFGMHVHAGITFTWTQGDDW
jgi:hypothetical protein